MHFFKYFFAAVACLNATYLILDLLMRNIPSTRRAAAAGLCLRACHSGAGQMSPEPPHQMAGDGSVG